MELAIDKAPYGGFPNVAEDYFPPVEWGLDYDSHYPFEGRISWWIEDTEDTKHFDNIPTHIGRVIEWTDHPHDSDTDEYEHVERQIFELKKSYSAIPQIFRILKNDVCMCYEKSEIFLNARIQDMANRIPVYEMGIIDQVATSRSNLLKNRKKIRSQYEQKLSFIEKQEVKAISACKENLDWCIAHHHNPQAHLNRGLFHYLEGEITEALDQANAALEISEKEEFEEIKDTALLLKGQSELEAGQYADAVLTLTELVDRNPANKEAYFERAAAYFETGEFDKSLSDYLSSEMKSSDKETNSLFSLEYASGLTDGIKRGFQEEFGDNLPAWASMMSFGLWSAIANSPLPSVKIVTATLSCVAAAGIYLAADQMVSELKELVTNWDQLSQHDRGELSGYLVGKYGIDVFACVGSVKVMEAYRDLKKANNLFTFEVALTNEARLATLKKKYKTIEKTKKDQDYIKSTFRNNHYPEQEIRDNLQKMGYSISKRPEGIPENCLTRYSDKGCGISYHDSAKPNYSNDRLMPGKPHSPNPKQQQPYIIQMRNGHCLDRKGKIVPQKSPNAHLSPEEYVFRPWNYKPEVENVP